MKLARGEKTIRQADTQHEVWQRFSFTVGSAENSGAIALGVNAPPAEVSLDPRFGDRSEALAREGADFFQTLPGILLPFETFGLLRLGFLEWLYLRAHVWSF